MPKQIIRIVLYGVGLSSLGGRCLFRRPVHRVRRLASAREPRSSANRHSAARRRRGRYRRLRLLPASQGRQGDRRRHQRRRTARQRRAGAQGAHEGCARDAEDGERQQVRLPLRSALVRHHRSARRGQDHGAGQFRPEISARARGATPAAIAGVGGTRYCDWWFTEEAVLIDTAGRYTTQDSDAKADKESWFAFLDLLKKSRPRQPINGVLVAISIEDILTLPKQELAAHADAIRDAPARTAPAAQGQFPGLCAVHQGRSGRGLHRIFRPISARPAGARSGARRSRPPTRRKNLVGDSSRRVRPSAGAPERGDARPAAGRADAAAPRAIVRLPGADGAR